MITVAAKAITTKFYEQPIARSHSVWLLSALRGGLMEAQRFPEDFDGLLPIAPVYDLTGRVIAGAWNAQAVADEQKGSVLKKRSRKLFTNPSWRGAALRRAWTKAS